MIPHSFFDSRLLLSTAAALLLLSSTSACLRTDGCSASNDSPRSKDKPSRPDDSDRTARRNTSGAGEKDAPDRRPTEEVVSSFRPTTTEAEEPGELERLRTLLEGERFRFGDDSTSSGSTWLTLSAWSSDAAERPDRVLAIDPTSGERRDVSLDNVGKTEGPVRWSRVHDELLLLEAGDGLEEAVLHNIEANRRIEPDVKLPDGIDAASFELQQRSVPRKTPSSSPALWLSGRHDGSNYAGIWQPNDGEIALRALDVPYERIELLGRNEDAYLVTSAAYLSPGGRSGIQGGCAFWRVPPSAPAECGFELPHGDRPDQLEHLGMGWVLVATWGTDKPRVVGPDSRVKLGTGMCEEPFVLAWRTGEPGAVASCFSTGSSAEHPYEFWSPNRHYRFLAPQSTETDRRIRSRSRAVASRTEPIIWHWWGSEASRADTWFDFRSGRYWTSDPLFPLPFGHRRSGSPVLATDQKSGEKLVLYALDFDDGTRRRLATYTDCEGSLRERDRSSEFALVDCVRKPDPDTFRFELVWSELVDLQSGAQFRIDDYPHALFSEGRVVVSNRTKARPGRYRPGDELWVVAPPRVDSESKTDAGQ